MAVAGPLGPLVAPPYDVIGPEERQELRGRSRYNVVHLTLPDSEDEAAASLAEWQRRGILVRDPEPACWWLVQEYVDPDGVARRREAPAWPLSVIVPTGQEGLTIFPTHRIAENAGTASGTPIDPPGNGLPGPVLYRAGGYELLSGDGPDPEVVEHASPRGLTYTP